jgi:hypothetical protein
MATLFSAGVALLIASSAQAAITGSFDLSASPTGWDVNDAGAIRQTIYGNTTSIRGFGLTREEGQSMLIDSATTIRSAQFEMTNVEPDHEVQVNIWLAQGSVDLYDVVEGQGGDFGFGSDHSTYFMYFDEANSQMHEATADDPTAVTINGATLLDSGTVTTPSSATGSGQHGILTLDLGEIAASAGDQVIITFTDLTQDSIRPWWFYRAATGDISTASSTDGTPDNLVRVPSYSYTNYVDPDTFAVTPYPGTGTYFETYRYPTINTDIAGVLIPSEKQLTFQLSSNAVVPEPASLGLLLVGGLMMLRRR